MAEPAATTAAVPDDSLRVNLLGMSRAGLGSYFESLGEKPFRAQQVFKWMYQEGVTDFDAMTNLSKVLRGKLADQAVVKPLEITHEAISADGTRKWLMALEGVGENAIEVVYIPEDDRSTLCISSQVGCGLNCSFCATARQGFNRNLSVAEIVGQVWTAWHRLGAQGVKASGEGKDKRPISNIVLMGMGEPLLNYEAVITAISVLRDDFGFGLSKRRITLSTSGVVPEMARLAQDMPVSLAVSLHAPDDALRTELVPLNKKYPIAVLLEACRQYVKDSRRDRVTFEYLLLDGVNDSDAHARKLAKILADVPAKINLIPYNPVQGLTYKRSPMKRVNAFREILMQKGIITVTRKTRGDDIDAACGQLVGSVRDRTRRAERLRAQVPVSPVAAQ